MKYFYWPTRLTLLVLCFTLFSCTVRPEQASLIPNSEKETVILLHGLGRSNSAMWLMAWRLKDAGFDVHQVDYDSLNVSIATIEQDVTGQMDEIINQRPGTIHFVGHSLGGLLIRAYLDEHQPKRLGRVVLIGSPNHGTPLVNQFQDSWLMDMLGEAALALGTDELSFPNTLGEPYYPVGVIAGVDNSCIADSFMKEDNDGLVPVSSTKLSNMTDFVVLETGHSAMRYDKDVAAQTAHFLRSGTFLKMEDLPDKIM